MPNEASVSTEMLQEDAGSDPSCLYFIDIKSTAVLSREEEATLARRVKKGDMQAKDLFIRHNLRLVVSIAKHYIRRCRKLAFSDLIQEGNCGLLKALDRFDPERGFRFSTYATDWIHAEISYSIDKNDALIYLPRDVIQLKRRLFFAEEQFVSQYGRAPTDVELSGALGITRKRLAALYLSGYANTSLDAGYSDDDDDDANLHQFIIDENVAAPEESTEQSLLRKAVQEFLSTTLDPREKAIVEMLFGFDESEGALNLSVIATKFGLSDKHIRRVYRKALRKLRCSVRGEKYDSVF